MLEDRPWENTFLNMFPSIWYDPRLSKYRVWYWAAVGCSGSLCPKDPTARPRGNGNCDDPNAVSHGGASAPLAASEYSRGWYPMSAAILYAESVDGVVFTKPSLNLTTIDGATSRGP